MGFWSQWPPAGQDFEKRHLFFDFDDFCEFLDSPSGVLASRWPPAGQFFEKRHLFFDFVDFCEFLDSQVWNSGASCLRRVRILKNDISFAFLMISASFWTPKLGILSTWANGPQAQGPRA